MGSPVNDEDPLARRRAAPRRRVPGRPGLGDDVTRRIVLVTLVVLAVATVVLVAVATRVR